MASSIYDNEARKTDRAKNLAAQQQTTASIIKKNLEASKASDGTVKKTVYEESQYVTPSSSGSTAPKTVTTPKTSAGSSLTGDSAVDALIAPEEVIAQDDEEEEYEEEVYEEEVYEEEPEEPAFTPYESRSSAVNIVTGTKPQAAARIANQKAELTALNEQENKKPEEPKKDDDIYNNPGRQADRAENLAAWQEELDARETEKANAAESAVSEYIEADNTGSVFKEEELNELARYLRDAQEGKLDERVYNDAVLMLEEGAFRAHMVGDDALAAQYSAAVEKVDAMRPTYNDYYDEARKKYAPDVQELKTLIDQDFAEAEAYIDGVIQQQNAALEDNWANYVLMYGSAGAKQLMNQYALPEQQVQKQAQDMRKQLELERMAVEADFMHTDSPQFMAKYYPQYHEAEFDAMMRGVPSPAENAAVSDIVKNLDDPRYGSPVLGKAIQILGDYAYQAHASLPVEVTKFAANLTDGKGLSPAQKSLIESESVFNAFNEGAKADLSESGKEWYDRFMSMAVSLSSRLYGGGAAQAGTSFLSKLTPQSLGLVTLATKAGAQNANEAFSRGATDAQAIAHGIAGFLGEYAGESISWGKLEDLAKSNPRALKEFVGGLLSSGATEGLEEGLSYVVSTLSDILVLGNKGDILPQILEKVGNDAGLAEKVYAGATIVLPALFDAMKEGAITGGIMGGGAQIAGVALSGNGSQFLSNVADDIKSVWNERSHGIVAPGFTIPDTPAAPITAPQTDSAVEALVNPQGVQESAAETVAGQTEDSAVNALVNPLGTVADSASVDSATPQVQETIPEQTAPQTQDTAAPQVQGAQETERIRPADVTMADTMAGWNAQEIEQRVSRTPESFIESLKNENSTKLVQAIEQTQNEAYRFNQTAQEIKKGLNLDEDGLALYDAIIKNPANEENIRLAVQKYGRGFMAAVRQEISANAAKKQVSDYARAIKRTQHERAEQILGANVQTLFKPTAPISRVTNYLRHTNEVFRNAFSDPKKAKEVHNTIIGSFDTNERIANQWKDKHADKVESLRVNAFESLADMLISDTGLTKDGAPILTMQELESLAQANLTRAQVKALAQCAHAMQNATKTLNKQIAKSGMQLETAQVYFGDSKLNDKLPKSVRDAYTAWQQTAQEQMEKAQRVTNNPAALKVTELVGGGHANIQAVTDMRSFDIDKIKQLSKTLDDFYSEAWDAARSVYLLNGYKDIGYAGKVDENGSRYGYRPHTTKDPSAASRGILDLFRTQNTAALPIAIVGETENFTPGRRYMPNFQASRNTQSASYLDSLAGFYQYLDGAADTIFHTADIQGARAFIQQIRSAYADESKLRAIRAIEDNADLTQEEKWNMIETQWANTEGAAAPFVTWMTDWTNMVAGKTNPVDRAAERWVGRESLNVLANIKARTGQAMIKGSLSSALSNLAPLAQASDISEVGMTKAIMRAAVDFARKDASFYDQFDFAVNRTAEKYRGADYSKGAARVVKSAWNLDTMGMVDNPVTMILTRAYYDQAIADGKTHAQAVEWTNERLHAQVAGRSKGQDPIAFNSKLLGLGTQFKRESSRDLIARPVAMYRSIAENESLSKPQKIARAAAATVRGLVWPMVFAEMMQNTIGYAVAISPVHLIADTLKAFGAIDEDDDEETFFEDVKQVWDAVRDKLTGGDAETTIMEAIGDLLNLEKGEGLDAMGYENTQETVEAILSPLWEEFPLIGSRQGESSIPFVGTATRLFTDSAQAFDYLFTDKFTPLQKGEMFAQGLGRDILRTFVPGGNQIAKTVLGAYDLIKGEHGGYDKWDKEYETMYEVEREPQDILQTLLFGPSANEGAREFYGGSRTDPGLAQLTENGMERDTAKDALASMDDAQGIKGEDGKTISGSVRNEIMRDFVELGLTYDEMRLAFEYDERKTQIIDDMETAGRYGLSNEQYMDYFVDGENAMSLNSENQEAMLKAYKAGTFTDLDTMAQQVNAFTGAKSVDADGDGEPDMYSKRDAAVQALIDEGADSAQIAAIYATQYDDSTDYTDAMQKAEKAGISPQDFVTAFEGKAASTALGNLDAFIESRKKEVGMDAGQFADMLDIVSNTQGVKDANGETINGSKKYNIYTALKESGLSESQIVWTMTQRKQSDGEPMYKNMEIDYAPAGAPQITAGSDGTGQGKTGASSGTASTASTGAYGASKHDLTKGDIKRRNTAIPNYVKNMGVDEKNAAVLWDGLYTITGDGRNVKRMEYLKEAGFSEKAIAWIWNAPQSEGGFGYKSDYRKYYGASSGEARDSGGSGSSASSASSAQRQTAQNTQKKAQMQASTADFMQRWGLTGNPFGTSSGGMNYSGYASMLGLTQQAAKRLYDTIPLLAPLGGSALVSHLRGMGLTDQAISRLWKMPIDQGGLGRTDDLNQYLAA